MKASISGLNGFIGSHLKTLLEQKGYEVVGINRDILIDPIELTQFFIREVPDHIIHLAAYGNHHDQTDRIETFYSNVTKTFMLLEATAIYKYDSFINVSSSSVYGRKDKPMSEDMSLGTDTFYGCSKVAGEYLARSYAKELDRPIVNVRPFSVYGPKESDNRFIPTVARSIHEGTTLSLDPKPKHDWIYVEDFCEALILIMENANSLKGETINIGTGKQYSNSEIVEKIEWILDARCDIKEVAGQRKYDNSSWVADTTKLTKLGWKPRYDIMRGLKRTASVKVDIYD
jgi:dTDP-glucose 4,6-dehydratase